MARVACIGECMLELSGADDSAMTLSFGGDTLNTAVYLARLGVGVDYVTALGDDPYSDRMIAAWRAEGVGTDHVLRAEGRLPGLYAIRTDAGGERQFFYWRGDAPVRDLFRFPECDRVAARLADYDWIYLSGVTLSLFGSADRRRLFGWLDAARARGARVAFDSNYRPRGWPDREAARGAFSEMLKRVDLAMPTLDDDRQVFGDTDAESCARRLRGCGVAESVVKLDADGCYVSAAAIRERVVTEPCPAPLDTTGAGDAFNAGYLAARINGYEPVDAACRAHRLAGTVIMHRGAIMPRDAMPGERL